MNRRAPGNSRLPAYILGGLIAISIIWRIANPPPPKPPGPITDFPSWRSLHTIGLLASHSVNPAGTMWAGVWNDTPKSGAVRSAVWIIDLDAYTAKPCVLKAESYVPSLSWADDKTIRVLRLDSLAPTAKESELIYIDATTGKQQRTAALKAPVNRILAWPAGSGNFLGVVGAGPDVKLAVVSANGEIVGGEVKPGIKPDSEIYSDAALSADGKQFVFSALDTSATSGRSYYLANTSDGSVKHVFDLAQLPGRVDGIWVSANGILLVCSEREKFQAVLYDMKLGKLVAQNGGVSAADLATKWPGAPKNMTFITYQGGYDFDLTTGKATRVFDMSKLGSSDNYWREAVQDGRLYSLKNGNYASVSTPAGSIDIRELSKTGTLVRDFLPR